MEDKINKAIEVIACLREDKLKLERMNESLGRQLGDLRAEFDRHRKEPSISAAVENNPPPGFDGREIKKRLLKLAGKLAALEDSWT